MALTYVHEKVKGPKGKMTSVHFLVDSAATYTLLPYDIWRALGLKPKRSVDFRRADRTTLVLNPFTRELQPMRTLLV